MEIFTSTATIVVSDTDLSLDWDIRDCKEKMKRGIKYNLTISGVKRYIQNIYLMFLSREIDINCVKFIRKFINMQFFVKVVVLNRSYSTNTQPI